MTTEKRTNRFNGESVMLTPKEAKIHDEIFIHEVEATLEDYKTVEKGLHKFGKMNASAYMTLLD